MQWYVSQHGKTTGPFDEERLAMLVDWGRISREAFICDQQCSAWIAIRCSRFAQLFPSSPADAANSASGAGAPIEVERETKQALGLVAFSFFVAWLLMATM